MATIRSKKLKTGTAHELRYYQNNKQQHIYFPSEIPLKYVQAEKARVEREILLQKALTKQIDIPILTQKITLGEFADWYKKMRENNTELHCATTTLQRYIYAIIAFAATTGLKKPLSNITSHDINQFKLNRIKQGKTQAGINKDLHHLGHPFKLAKKHGLITRDIEITKFKVRKKLPDYLSPDELNRLFEKLPKGQVELAAHIIKWTGIRRTEICERCTKSDFNFETGYLTIHGKNNEEQVVPLHQELIEYLNNNPIFQNRKPSDPLITIDKHSLSDGIRVAKLRANINKKGRTHLLRHTLGTNLINEGYDIKEVQDLLRHKTLHMTTIYAQIIKTKFKKKYNTFKY